MVLRFLDLFMMHLFGLRCQEAVKITEPLVHLLRIVDGTHCPMAKVYKPLDVAKEIIAKFYDNDISKYKEIWDMIDWRWNKNLQRPLHVVAHCLYPCFVYAKEPGSYEPNREVRRSFVKTVGKLVIGLDAQEVIMDQLPQFLKGEGLMFSNPLAHRGSKKMSAARWWDEWGIDTLELRRFDMRVLSQPCSVSGCECN